MILTVDQKNRAFIVIQNTPRILLMIPLQSLLDSVTSRANLTFDHLLDQLFNRFVYGDDSPLTFSVAPETLVPFEVNVPQCRQCFCNDLRELVGVGGRQYNLNDGLDGRRAYKAKPTTPR
jgi:hypothetical protein